MSYDVVGAQILQTGIPSTKANLIGTTEVSVASLAEVLMLGVAIVANDVSHFRFLAMLSLLSVVGATWMFCRWLMNPTNEQKSLFHFDPQFWFHLFYGAELIPDWLKRTFPTFSDSQVFHVRKSIQSKWQGICFCFSLLSNSMAFYTILYVHQYYINNLMKSHQPCDPVPFFFLQDCWHKLICTRSCGYIVKRWIIHNLAQKEIRYTQIVFQAKKHDFQILSFHPFLWLTSTCILACTLHWINNNNMICYATTNMCSTRNLECYTKMRRVWLVWILSW